MKQKLTRIIISGLLLVVAMILEHTCKLNVWQLLLAYLVPYLIIGYDTLCEAAESIMDREPLNEDFLMAIATIGALCIGFLPEAENQFAEAVFVMLFFQVGELFEHYAEDKSRESISHLMDIRPDSANLLSGNTISVVAPESVSIGDIIVVKPGEKIPLDSIVTEGMSSLNTSALTGESLPHDVKADDEVVSGCINLSGILKLRVTKSFAESTVSKIIDMVEHASDKKSRSETFITRFARIYTPIVVLGAVILAIVPPVISGNFTDTFPTWLYRALMFLVVSCPCALVVSIPLSFFGGIGGASRNGILIKGASYMDMLARLSTVVFDKTGTLTQGEFQVTAIHPDSCDEHELLHLAAHVERYSTHPIAVSLKNAYPNETDDCDVEIIEEYAGKGIKARVNGNTVCVGNEKLMELIGVEWRSCHHEGTIVHVSIDNKYAGHIVIADKIKDGAVEAVSQLRKQGVENIVMLTGDREEAARQVATITGIDQYASNLLPTDKVEYMEHLLENTDYHPVAFVGDGINDAPVLARADVGIAMGALGSDAAIEAADIVLMDDEPAKIALAMSISRNTIAIAKQNVAFAITVKLLVLILATVGAATMWMAVFADVGVTVLAVLNAMRTLKK